MKYITILVLLLAPLVHATNALGASIFYFTSSPNSWVGQGQTLTLTAPKFTVRAFKYPDPSGNTISVTILNSGGDGWRVDFGAPNKAPLAVGSYPHASRYPFNVTSPGLAFSGYHRGDNTLSGSFEVREVALQPNKKMEKFAADFIQYDERQLTAWNIGSIRYNSDIPLGSVPEPSTLVLSILALAALPTRRRKSVPHNRV